MELPEAALRRVLIVQNPTAGWRRQKRVAAVRAELDGIGCQVELRRTEYAGHAREIAASLRPGECDVLAVAGGDGTINEVANGLRPDGPALAILPCGTANVMAHEIGLAIDPRSIASVIAHARPQPVFPGIVNGRRFVMMAGVGYDAHVVAAVTPALKRRLGKGAYVWHSLALMPSFRFRPYEVEIDGVATEAFSVVVSKGRFYAGHHLCAPEARLERPSVEVCLFRRGGATAVFNYGLALLTGRLPQRRDFEIVTGHRVRIRGGDGEPVQVDGDVLARLPVEISVAPDPFWLLRP